MLAYRVVVYVESLSGRGTTSVPGSIHPDYPPVRIRGRTRERELETTPEGRGGDGVLPFSVSPRKSGS